MPCFRHRSRANKSWPSWFQIDQLVCRREKNKKIGFAFFVIFVRNPVKSRIVGVINLYIHMIHEFILLSLWIKHYLWRHIDQSFTLEDHPVQHVSGRKMTLPFTTAASYSELCRWTMLMSETYLTKNSHISLICIFNATDYCNEI